MATFQDFLYLLGLPGLPGKENQYLSASNFTTPLECIEFNLYWEFKAIEGYKKHIDNALWYTDIKTAEVFQHNMSEEEEHFDELLKRYRELMSLNKR